MNSRIEQIKKTYSNHGFIPTVYTLGLNFLNRFFYIHILRCIVISKVKSSSLQIDEKYTHDFISRELLEQFSQDKDNELTGNFLKQARATGDECYGILEKDELAAYGWYSNNACPTDVLGLLFRFDPSYIYMYKGLTKKAYRGQRLHAVGMSWALKRYLERGSKGIVSYVDSTNYDSLKSCYRMGYHYVGSLVAVKLFGKVMTWRTPSCKKYGIHLETPKPSPLNQTEAQAF